MFPTIKFFPRFKQLFINSIEVIVGRVVRGDNSSEVEAVFSIVVSITKRVENDKCETVEIIILRRVVRNIVLHREST